MRIELELFNVNANSRWTYHTAFSAIVFGRTPAISDPVDIVLDIALIYIEF